MSKLRLTELAIRKLPFENGQRRIWDAALPGFGLTVGKRTKTFFVMYGPENSRRFKSLGRFPETNLSDARGAAKKLLASPPTPTSVKRLPKLAEAFMEDCKERLRPSSYDRYHDVLKHAPDIPLDQVTRSLAKTAHEIKAYKAMFNWAMREELTDRNPFVHMKATYGKRERVLTEAELKKVWQYEHPPFSDIVKLLILTGQRRSQIWKLEPAWIRGDTIVFPPNIMKQGEPHTIPFGELTARYLNKAPFTFNGWSKGKPRIDRHTGVTEWTIHDLRRTFATIHARLGTPIHVVEALLAHRSGTISGVAAIYIRHNWLEEMRQAVLAYEKHIATIIAA